MGTRADFYIGRGVTAEWLGSISMDGYHDGVSPVVRCARSADEYRTAVAAFLVFKAATFLCGYVIPPEDGWSWPWPDSRTTDYAYAFDDGKVHTSVFGHAWFDSNCPEPDGCCDGDKVAVFPSMVRT